MDGGLTFLPHPWVGGGALSSAGVDSDDFSFPFSGRTSDVGANTTAVDETDAAAEEPGLAIAAPTGSLIAEVLAF